MWDNHLHWWIPHVINLIKSENVVTIIDKHRSNQIYYHCEAYSDIRSSLFLINIRENSFVKIVGQLREYEGRKHVLIYDIAPVTDWNELTHHLLQIVYVHLQNTKGPIPVRLFIIYSQIICIICITNIFVTSMSSFITHAVLYFLYYAPVIFQNSTYIFFF